MTTAFGVIGSNYGDEGKGRNVDALVRTLGDGTVVVRSNGGAQAGHTVVSPQGVRHVFHHLGSGALAGAATHLSRFFVHHPMTFMAERDALEALGACVRVTADPRGMVTTPWDMMVNQAVEISRGRNRHGSCGYGLGETVGRNEDTGFGLRFSHLSGDDLRSRLIGIRDVWLPARLAKLGVEPDPETAEAIASEAVMARFLEDCATFVDAVDLVDDAVLGSAPAVVFEGAQGLLLDQRGRDFPHVTRSNTGIANMSSIAREAGIGLIEARYATRAYLTRHGAGPMPDERGLGEWFDVVDETNVPNPWQSAIRHGLLDVDLLAASIHDDLAKAQGVEVVPMLAVSCLDQAIADIVPVLFDGQRIDLPVGQATARIAEMIGFENHLEWWSPSNPSDGSPIRAQAGANSSSLVSVTPASALTR